MIYIVPDSNIFYQTKFRYFDEFRLNKYFDELINIARKSNLKNGLRILIPEIVLEELKRKKLEEYQKKVSELNELASSMGIYVSLEIKKTAKEYREELAKQVNAYISKYPQVHVMPVCKSKYFHKIVDKAIDKNPPFEGKEKQSDKGFKDTVIYYSMIDYAKEYPGDYYYLTKDTIFSGNGYDLLRNEFKKETNLNLRIFDDIKKLEAEMTTALPVVKVDRALIEYKDIELLLGFGKTTIIPVKEIVLQGKDKNIARINSDLQRIYTYKKISWVDWFDNCDDVREILEGTISSEILYNQNGILSLKISEYTYLGGPHGNHMWISRTYCLDTGEILSLTEILQKDSETILHLVSDKWNEYKLQNKGIDCYPDFNARYESVDNIHYYVNNEGVIVYFDEYEAGPYSAGIIEFLLVPIDMVEMA